MRATMQQIHEAVRAAGLWGRLVQGRIPVGESVRVSGYEPEPFEAVILGATDPSGWHFAVLREDGRVVRGVHVTSIIREERR